MRSVFSARQAPGLPSGSSGVIPPSPHHAPADAAPQGRLQQSRGPPRPPGGMRPAGPQGRSQQPPGSSGAAGPAGVQDGAGSKLGAAAKAAQQSAAQQHQDLVAKARHREQELLIGGIGPPPPLPARVSWLTSLIGC